MSVAGSMGTNGTESVGGAIELISDRDFKLGFNVQDPTRGKKVIQGVLQWDAPGAEPIWNLAQWTSKFTIAGAAPERLASGAVRFANQAKTIVVGPSGTDEEGLTLGVDSRPEWGQQARKKGEPWPHLLVAQRLSACPPLTQLEALEFRVEARLLHGERFTTADYSPSLHCAHYLIHFTVQDLNPKSPGRGDFLWFGIPLYDDRWPMPRKHIAGDTASGKLIYDLGAEPYTSDTLQSGKWVTLQGNLLPQMLEAVRTAWERGFLKESKELSDFALGGMNMGWEVTGINYAAVQVRGLSLRAIGR